MKKIKKDAKSSQNSGTTNSFSNRLVPIDSNGSATNNHASSKKASIEEKGNAEKEVAGGID